MLDFLKEKWSNIYTWVDYFWWKNKTDIIYFIIFIIVTTVYTIDYMNSH